MKQIIKRAHYAIYILLTCVMCGCGKEQQEVEIEIKVDYEIGYIERGADLDNFLSARNNMFYWLNSENEYLANAYVIRFYCDGHCACYADTSYNNICNIIEAKKKLFTEYVYSEKEKQYKRKIKQDSINDNLRVIRDCVGNAR